MIEEKMVPIDTSGNSVEVELKDETVSTEVDVPENNVREIIEEIGGHFRCQTCLFYG